MAEKEKRKAELEAIDGPRLFTRGDGSQGKAWTLFFDGFKAEIYSDKGFEIAKGLKGQEIEVEIEYKGEYQGTPQYKLVSIPGHWESGGWKGGGGRGRSPEEIKSIEAQNAAKVTAWLAQTSNPDASFTWFKNHLSEVQALIRDASGQTQSEPSSNGSGNKAALEALETALEDAIKDWGARRAFIDLFLANNKKSSLGELTEEEITKFLDAIPQPQES